MNSTGEMIKMLRMKRGLSQEELGEILGVGKSAIQKYENGRIQNIKLDVLRHICTYFMVPPLALLFPEKAKYFNLGDDIFDATTVMICLKLNDEAKEKVKTYIMDLSLIDKYRREEHTVRNPKETSHKTYEAENLPGKRFSHDDTNTHIQEI